MFFAKYLLRLVCSPDSICRFSRSVFEAYFATVLAATALVVYQNGAVIGRSGYLFDIFFVLLAGYAA